MTFSCARLEERFKSLQTRRLAAADAQSYAIGSLLWLWCWLWLSLRERAVRPGLAQGLAGLLLHIALLLLSHFAQETYRRWRSFCVRAYRIAGMFLPGLPSWIARFPKDKQIKASLISFLSIFVLGAQVMRAWALAIGLRVDLPIHIVLHGLLAFRVLAVHAPQFCALQYLMNDATQAQFEVLARRISSWIALATGMPSEEWLVPGAAAAPMLTLRSCYALTITVHLICGTLLSSVAVYVMEQSCRATFLREEADAMGVPLWEACHLLGLSLDKGVRIYMFDATGTWARALALSLPLASLAWAGAGALGAQMGLAEAATCPGT